MDFYVLGVNGHDDNRISASKFQCQPILDCVGVGWKRFTEVDGNAIGKITPAGAITEFPWHGRPGGITGGAPEEIRTPDPQIRLIVSTALIFLDFP